MSEIHLVENFNTLIQNVRFGPCIYVGALGFEDRCLGALNDTLKIENLKALFYFITLGGQRDVRGHKERNAKQRYNLQKLKIACKSRPLDILECPLSNPECAIEAAVLKLKDFHDCNLILDFSTMPKSVFFPLFQQLWKTQNTNIIAVYSLPIEYSSDALFYETDKPKLIAGFHGKPIDNSLPGAWIPTLGFEGQIAVEIMKWGGFDKVFPIISFPGYRATYVDRVVHANLELLSFS
ncbi:MAG: hypothetical protein MUO64_13570 [Anaerolineales bacterium]|nr:hypothetical protein [Anaerolineales bacterium]